MNPIPQLAGQVVNLAHHRRVDKGDPVCALRAAIGRPLGRICRWLLGGGEDGPRFVHERSNSLLIGRHAAITVRLWQILRVAQCERNLGTVRGTDQWQRFGRDAGGPRTLGGIPKEVAPHRDSLYGCCVGTPIRWAAVGGGCHDVGNGCKRGERGRVEGAEGVVLLNQGGGSTEVLGKKSGVVLGSRRVRAFGSVGVLKEGKEVTILGCCDSQ